MVVVQKSLRIPLQKPNSIFPSPAAQSRLVRFTNEESVELTKEKSRKKGPSVVAVAAARGGAAAVSANAKLDKVDSIILAESAFNGEAFKAERYRQGQRVFYEVYVLSGNSIYEVVVNANRGNVVEWDRYNQKRRATRVSAALNNAQFSLIDAVEIAQEALPGSNAIEAKLRLSNNPNRNGKRFLVETRDGPELYDVVINSRNGRVVKIDRD
jgi:uncharacterized membrane protein YkoI